MSRAIDIDGTTEKLFVLQHLAHGSKAYCRSEGILTLEQTGFPSFPSTWGWTKSIVSNYLIECAVKLRMIQEHCHKHRGLAAKELGDEAVLALAIGHVLEGSFELTLREASNKIVHATSVRTDFSAEDGSTEGVHFWDGQAHLFGEMQKKEWHVQLDVAHWAKASSRYLELAQDSGLIDELGQDWA